MDGGTVLIAFDLDGVLLDSQGIVLEGYRRAGVEPPQDIFAFEGVDWISWQVGKDQVVDVRNQKNTYYLKHIHKAPKLSGYRTACRLADDGHYLVILSAAPIGTINQLEKSFNDWPFAACRDGVRTPQKMKILRALSERPMHLIGSRHIRPVYVDDQDHATKIPPPWKFIRYQGQTEDILWKEVTRP